MFFSSAATLAAERVVLPEGEQLICTYRVNTHNNRMRVDDFGYPLITTSPKDYIKIEYEKWSKKKYFFDVEYKYTFTTSENNETVILRGLRHHPPVTFIKIKDDEYVPKDEFDPDKTSYLYDVRYSEHLVFYKNNNDHYFAYTTRATYSWVDMCVLD